MDSDIISTGISRSQRDRIKLMREIIRELQEDFEGAVPIRDITKKAVESGFKEDDIEDMLYKMKTAGEIIEPSGGKYRVV